MDRRWQPAAVGLGAGGLLFVAPGGVGGLIVCAGALAAGWLLPAAPMVAALLYLAPTMAVGGLRLLLDDSIDVGAVEMTMAVVSAVLFIGILTHIGAGVALRRAARS